MQLPAENPRVERVNGDWYYRGQQILHPGIARAAEDPPAPTACAHCHLPRVDAVHFPELADRWYPISRQLLPTHEYTAPSADVRQARMLARAQGVRRRPADLPPV